MKKQFVVLGLGNFGASVAVTLQRLGCDVVAVDQDMERIEDVEGSIMATLAAKEAGIPYVLCKAHNKRYAEVLRKVGADAVVFPEKEMGKRIAKNLVSANLADWIALSPDYSVVEAAIPKKWVGKTLKELDVRKSYEVNVVGIKEGERVEITPDPNTPLKPGMILMLVGSNEALRRI